MQDLRTAPDPATGDLPRRGRPRAEDRSEAILDSVVTLFKGVGYDQLRMQDVADAAGVGLATIYRRWPTKQELVIAALRHSAARTSYPDTGNPRADLAAIFEQLATDLSGTSCTLRGAMSCLWDDPEVGRVLRDTKIAAMHGHLRDLIGAVIGTDHPELQLRAELGPALLTYRAVFLADPLPPRDAAREVTELVLATAEPPSRR